MDEYGRLPDHEVYLNVTVATGRQRSAFHHDALTKLHNAVTAYAIHLINVSFSVSALRGAAVLGERQVEVAIDSTLNPRDKGIDWSLLLCGGSLGVLGNAVPDWIPFDQVTPETGAISIISLGLAALFAGWSSRRKR